MMQIMSLAQVMVVLMRIRTFMFVLMLMFARMFTRMVVFMFVLLDIKMISPGLVTDLNFSEHLGLKIVVILLGNNIFV